MKLEFTERGFARGEFTDTYGQKCRLQKSSLATAERIWLGAFEKGPHLSEVGAMHLGREEVAALLPYLTAFVETGDMMAVDRTDVERAHAASAREALANELHQAAANLEDAGYQPLAYALRELADPTPIDQPAEESAQEVPGA